jgi:hypothetical protein
MSEFNFNLVKISIFLLITWLNVNYIAGCFSSPQSPKRCVPINLCVIDAKKIYFNDFFCSKKHKMVCCSEDLIIKEISALKNQTTSATSTIRASDQENSVTEATVSVTVSPIMTADIEEPSEKPDPFDLNSCGVFNHQNRISNGEETELLEYTWAALIEYKEKQTFNLGCGGSLIHGNLKLTELVYLALNIAIFRMVCTDRCTLFKIKSMAKCVG